MDLRILANDLEALSEVHNTAPRGAYALTRLHDVLTGNLPTIITTLRRMATLENPNDALALQVGCLTAMRDEQCISNGRTMIASLLSTIERLQE